MEENNGAHRNPLCTYWLSRKRALCVTCESGNSCAGVHMGVEILVLEFGTGVRNFKVEILVLCSYFALKVAIVPGER